MKDIFSKRLSLDTWKLASIALEKSYVYAEPTDAIVGYLEQNIAYIANIALKAFYVLGDTIEIGPALDIAVCYDARWTDTGDGIYKYYTFGSPYIAIVDTNQKLTIQHGANGAKIQLASGVSRCWMIRGWKHVTDPTVDQGLCIFYLKGGRLFSRAYVQTEVNTFAWSTEESYPMLPSNILELSVKRTNDFRLMLAVSSQMGNLVLVTDRTWPGQAIPAETVNTVIKYKNTLKCTYAPIIWINNYTAETVKVDAQRKNIIKYGHNELIGYVDANNELGEQINVMYNGLINPDLLGPKAAVNFVVKDSKEFVYPVTDVKFEYPFIKLSVLDFNNAQGDITVTYNGLLTTVHNLALPGGTRTFTPKGLVPQPAEPPTIVSIYNVDSEVM